MVIHKPEWCGKDNSRKFLLKLGWERVPNCECMFVHRKQGLFLSVHDIRKKQNMAPMWKKLMKDVDLEEPTSFLDHVCLVCTHRECKPNESINQETVSHGSGRPTTTWCGLPGWRQQDDQVHPVLRRSRLILSFGRP